MFDIDNLQRLQNARLAGKLTDFAFYCHGQTIPVHKIIICAYSDVFEAACTGPFKEAISGIYDMSAHPLALVQGMVDYMYTGSYSVPKTSPLSTHALMLSLAHKYNLKGLERESTEEYLDHAENEQCDMSDFISSVCELYQVPLQASKLARDGALIFARLELSPRSWADDAEPIIEELCDACPEFMKDFMLFTLKYPDLWCCENTDCTKRRIRDMETVCGYCHAGNVSPGLPFRDWQNLLNGSIKLGQRRDDLRGGYYETLHS